MALITRKEVIATFPGSFDPFTLGHNDVLGQGLKIFDKVKLLIAKNQKKGGGLFTPKEKVELIKKSLKELKVKGASRVEIDFLEEGGMTVRRMRKIASTVLIRSFRSITDWEFELNLAHHNRKQAPNIVTVFIAPALEFQIVSSTDARGGASLHGIIDYMVSPSVEKALREKYK